MMNYLQIKTKLTDNDYDKIIAKILDDLVNDNKHYYIHSWEISYDDPTIRFLYNICSILQLLKPQKIGVFAKRRYCKKFIKRTGTHFLYCLKRAPIEEKYEDIVFYCNKTIHELYPNEVPYIVMREIGRKYYMTEEETAE